MSFYVSEITSFLLFNEFSSISDVTPSSSAMDWFAICSVHDTRIIFQ